jgi:hypothetical protein
MLRPWAQWFIDHNLKVVLYAILIVALPIFWLAYIREAMDDAEYAFDRIKSAKKGQ